MQSEKNLRYYIGSTNRKDERIKEHNDGLVKSTKFLRPWSLKVFIPCATLRQARQFEYRLKQYKRKDIIELVIKDKIFPWDYQHKGN